MTDQLEAKESLADLLIRIGSDGELSEQRRRDLRSSLRRLARIVDRDPAMIKVDFMMLRSLIRDVHPRQAGLSPKRWSNIRSDVRFAVQRYQLRPPHRLARHLGREWRALRDHIQDDRIERGLSRLIHYCDRRDLGPREVTRTTFDEYHRWLREETMVRKPDRVFKHTCQQWNRAMALVPGWPRLEVPVPDFTDHFSLPRETFPVSFRDDVERWRCCLAGVDLLEVGPAKPLRPVSVSHSVGQVYRFASALVHQGHDPARIVGLSYLVEPEHFKAGLRFFLKRHGGVATPGLSELASTIVHLARHWVSVDETTLKTLRTIATKVRCRPRGLSEKNRNRLRQFDDPRAQLAILDLPDRLVRLARGCQNAVKGALQAQTALAIALLLRAPIRLSNLASLNLHEHICRQRAGRRGAVHLVITREQTKNSEPLEFPLPADLTSLLDLYLTAYRPLLLKGSDQGWLWPGRNGAPKHKTTLCGQIIKAVLDHTGLVVNVHLFRHLAGKLSLQEDPGNYEQVRRLLGHKSIDTTTLFYTGFETAAAARRYHEQVLAPRLTLSRNRRP